MTRHPSETIRLSAEWAAYGDALGFMTELADAERVRYRSGAEYVSATSSWRRKVGGYSGTTFELPAGTYSDDTQLRLATARAIRADGSFDVAAFAKVELTAWSNYALGAGISSKEAAANLARTSATWYSNFFGGKRSAYVKSGGNGAAMRVQPHVWAARDLSKYDEILLDVFRNSICTHGHPRGFVGACFHALSLAFAMRTGSPASLLELAKQAEVLRGLPLLIERDRDIRILWLDAWQKASNRSFTDGVNDAVDEIVQYLDKLSALDGNSLDVAYPDALDLLAAKADQSRGSGTVTAVLAAFASSVADVSDPKRALLVLANALGSDTDSIASMAGAIVGASTTVECSDTIQDISYIRESALRLAKVSAGEKAQSFRYPDLRSWKPERTAIDVVGLIDDALYLNGLGRLEKLASKESKETGNETLGWFRTEFGQTILARSRSEKKVLSPNFSSANANSSNGQDARGARPPGRLADLFTKSEPQVLSRKNQSEVDDGGVSLNELLKRIIADNFDPETVGRALLQQVKEGNGDFVERGVALTATVLTAYEARLKRTSR